MFNLQDIALQSPHVLSEIIEHEAVLIAPERAQSQVLNQTGAHIWQLLDGRHTLAQIADELARAYAVSPSQAVDDVLAFIEQLAARGLVTFLASP